MNFFGGLFLVLLGVLVSSVGFVFQSSNTAAIIICASLGALFILFGLAICVAVIFWPASVYVDNEVIELRGRKTIQRVKCSDLVNVHVSPLNGNIIIDTQVKQALVIPPAFEKRKLLFSILKSLVVKKIIEPNEPTRQP
jgi:hypothetical protein